VATDTVQCGGGVTGFVGSAVGGVYPPDGGASMRIIFLDIDGVLNCGDRWAELAPYMRGRRGSRLDPVAVRQVWDLIVQTGARVVISSAWRVQYTLAQLREMLGAAGFVDPERVIGVTPVAACRTASGLWLAVQRGDEIQQWLDGHPEVTQYVVLDDASDMGQSGVAARLVQTTWAGGLTEAHVQRAKAMLT
jgi:hypothetical protein